MAEQYGAVTDWLNDAVCEASPLFLSPYGPAIAGADDVHFWTDLHSHFRGVLTGEDYVGLLHQQQCNPTIPASWVGREQDVPFHAATAEDLKAIELMLEVGTESTSDFDILEIAYQNREYLESKCDLFIPELALILKRYQEEGRKHISLSTSKIASRGHLQMIADYLPELERVYAITTEFLYSVPRNQTPELSEERMEALDAILKHPYVNGIDIVGKEVDCIKQFEGVIKRIADHVEPKMDELCYVVMRFHAGESRACHDNIKTSLQFIEEHPHIHVRIGHGNFGLDEETLDIMGQLAKEGRLIVEINPISNMRLGYIDIQAHDWPIEKYLKHNIPLVVGSDGIGIYGAKMKDLFPTLMKSPKTKALKEALLENIRQTEQHYLTLIQKVRSCKFAKIV